LKTIENTTSENQTMKTGASRTIDPGIEALRKEHSFRVESLKKARRSAKILQGILTKKIPDLTASDQEKLSDHLLKIVTPPLLVEPVTNPTPLPPTQQNPVGIPPKAAVKVQPIPAPPVKRP